jgi:putative membrane protein
MDVAGLVIAGIAALIHGYIFWLESISWTTDRTRAVFGTSMAEARATRALAFNQGFYNLFLAVGVLAGILAFAAGAVVVGATLVFASAASMVLAGVVLVSSDPSKAKAAFIQLVPPLIGLIVLGIGLG